MRFWQVYFKLLFSRMVWTHWFVVFLVALHLYGFATGTNDWWRLPLGFVVIFLAVALFVLVGSIQGYLAHRESERDKVQCGVHREP